MSEDILEQVRRAQAIIEGEQDNLCKALLSLASYRAITVIPRDDKLVSKPVIIVPQQMYDRMLKLSEARDD